MLTWKYGNLGQDNKNLVEIDGKNESNPKHVSLVITQASMHSYKCENMHPGNLTENEDCIFVP